MGQLSTVRKGLVKDSYRAGRAAAEVETKTTRAALKAMKDAGQPVPRKALLAAAAGRYRDPLLAGAGAGVALGSVRVGGGRREVEKGLVARSLGTTAADVKVLGLRNAAKVGWAGTKGSTKASFQASRAGAPQASARRYGQMIGADDEQRAIRSLRGTVGKADRDQNSLRSPVGTTMVMPKGDHRSSSTKANGKHESSQGRNGGVGRHLTRDQNSSPGATTVRTPTLREINGKFAGQGYGVKMFTPIGGSKRGAVHGKGIFRTTKGSQLKVGVKKADEPRKGMLGSYDLANMQVHTGARVGRRL